MTIQSVSNISSLAAQVGIQAPRVPTAAEIAKPSTADASSFTDRIGSAIQDIGKAQDKASQSATDYARGTEQNLASVMIDQQVAQLGLQLAINVRNKALGAYKDIMNMPV